MKNHVFIFDDRFLGVEEPCFGLDLFLEYRYFVHNLDHDELRLHLSLGSMVDFLVMKNLVMVAALSDCQILFS